MESALFRDLAFVLAAALVGGAASIIFRLPLLTGYIVSGVVFAGLANFLQAGGEVLSLAQIGVILLLFTLGIEMSFARLSRVFQVAVFGGLIQILSTVLLGLLILPAFGVSGPAALVLAFGFSLSSTAVVVKLLQERAELDTLPGEILIGWLLVQDLAVIPMVVLLPILAGVEDGGFWQLPLSLIKAGILLGGAVLAGRVLVPAFLDWVVNTRSREFFLLSVVTFIFAVAGISSLFGFSPAIGAFLAGLVISETAQKHAVFAEVRPLREIFMILFFVSLGALIEPSFLFTSWQIILSLAVLFLITKFFLSFIITLGFGYHAKTAFFTGAGLANVGEFSFLLAVLAQNLGIMGQQEVSVVVGTTLLTLVIAPVIFGLRPKLWQHIRPVFALPFISGISGVDHRVFISEREELRGHVVLCGFGRMGSWLGRACQLANIPFVVIEYNSQVLKDLKDRGIPFVYGDPADREVLEAAQLSRARLLVIAIPDRHTQELAIAHARGINPKLEIISRAREEQDRTRLESLGVEHVFQPEFEAALSIAHRVLQEFGMTREEVANKLKTIKGEHTRLKIKD